MANVIIPIEDLAPIAELIEKVNYDRRRIIISKVHMSETRGLTMIFKDEFRNEFAEIRFSPSKTTDLIDEYPEKDFNWLMNTKDTTERDDILDGIRMHVLVRAGKLVNQPQLV